MRAQRDCTRKTSNGSRGCVLRFHRPDPRPVCRCVMSVSKSLLWESLLPLSISLLLLLQTSKLNSQISLTSSSSSSYGLPLCACAAYFEPFFAIYELGLLCFLGAWGRGQAIVGVPRLARIQRWLNPVRMVDFSLLAAVQGFVWLSALCHLNSSYTELLSLLELVVHGVGCAGSSYHLQFRERWQFLLHFGTVLALHLLSFLAKKPHRLKS